MPRVSLSMRAAAREGVKKKRTEQMSGPPYYTPVKIVGYVVLVLMAVAIVYAGYITLTHWSGIGV